MWFKVHKSAASHHALQDAEKHLQEVEQRGEEVSQVSRSIVGFRVRNHFGEHVDRMFDARVDAVVAQMLEGNQGDDTRH